MGFPSSPADKESACNAENRSWIPGLGRSRGGRYDNPLLYSSLENPHGQRSLAGYSAWSHKESDTSEQLSTHTCNATQKGYTLGVKSATGTQFKKIHRKKMLSRNPIMNLNKVKCYKHLNKIINALLNRSLKITTYEY